MMKKTKQRFTLKHNGALVLLLLCTGGVLAGCAAAAAGAAGAAAGYYLGKDERDASRIMKDSEISGQINSAYFSAPDIDAFAINVTTYNGVVTLTGKVQSEGVKARAIQIAQHTKGATQVISKIDVVPPGT